MSKKIKKPKVAFISLTSCEGCQFTILDLGKRLLKLLDDIEVEEFRLIEESPESPSYDIAFVEGNPITKENFSLLKRVRKKAKILVALGNCAALGGIWEIKNYRDKNKTIRYIYKHVKRVENPDIREIDNFVKVDYTLPGCPINAEEFLRVTYELIAGKKPKIEQQPVCYECITRGYECLLQKGEICLGPITLGGCGAICLENKQSCWGCRGLVKGCDIKNLVEELIGYRKHSKADVNMVLEIFGLRDSVEEELGKKSQKLKDKSPK